VLSLRIAVPPVIHERPRTIWRPLERSLRSTGKDFRQRGFTTVVVSIRRWIGKRYSVHHGYGTLSQERGAASLAAPPEEQAGDAGAPSVPYTSPTIR